MKSGIRLAFAIALCTAAAVLIQPLVAIGQQKPSADPAEPPQTILTGCLKSHAADTAIAGPSGRLYTLEVNETVPPSPSTTSSNPAPGATKTTYSLANEGNVDLEKHADHEVQLTGRMQAASTAAQERAAKASPTSPAPQPAPGGAHRTFRVTAVKMVSAKCS